jgi:ABC-2 type transport system permease protein
VFFSRDAVPAFLKPVSDLLPLTFLNDALRQVALSGASLGDVGADFIGIAVWSVVLFVIAFRFFKLEA